MKTFKMIVAGLILCSMTLFTSCKKEDVQPTGQTTTPTLSTRGGLAFRVKTNTGAAVQGATIGIALSQSELVTNNYLATRTTDGNGYADFGKLNADNYYYEVDVTVNNTAYHGEGVLQIQAGEDLVQELTIQ